MLTFLDGPAAACQGLLIRRAPRFLRVTRQGDTWDALDRLYHDFARPDELLYAYRLVESHGTVHLRRQRDSGCFVVATYRFVSPQPADETLRSNMSWRAWATEQAEKEKA